MTVKKSQLVRTVVAHNDAEDSGNPMHNDDAARALGYKAALVPGVTVYGYMTSQLLEYFGEAWLTDGCMAVSFRKPVFAGETQRIEASLEDDDSVIHINVVDPEGDVCVSGKAPMNRYEPAIHDSGYDLANTPIAAYRAMPNQKQPAARQSFEQERVLGSIFATFANKRAAEFLRQMQDHHHIYQHGTTHPAWLLRQANIIVDQNIAVGPWIHTANEIQSFGLATNDEPFEVRAQVLDLFEKKSHQYVDLDVVMLAEGDPERLICRVMHRAIYKMG